MGRSSDRRQQSSRKQENRASQRKERRAESHDNTRPHLASIHPKTSGQSEFQRVLRSNDLVFGLGPAGTGKTFLAVYEAVYALENGLVDRIILTRPAVEAGERLGFLPGDLSEKIAPYLHPLIHSLHKMLPKGRVDCHLKNGKIEVVPLAYMRGRTLDDAYIILDEAQNCTFDQLLMLLTRIGEGSRCVLTGDASQTDLLEQSSGLITMYRVLEKVAGVGAYEMAVEDVVRHTLVADIIRAVDAYRNGKLIRQVV